MDKKFFTGWVLLFVLWMAGSFAVHGALLHADYTALQGKLFRTEQDSQQYFPLMLLAHALLAGAFTWIYARGAEAGKPWLGQGIRYGIAVALLTVAVSRAGGVSAQPARPMWHGRRDHIASSG